MSAGLCSSITIAIGHVGAQLDLVDHRRGRGDQVEIELALQPLLDDFQVQQPEEAAAEAEAERRGGFHLEGERGVVEPQLAHGGAQIFEIRRIDGKQPAEHHRLRRLEARQAWRSVSGRR
jgi:hypothetical protein